MQLNTIGPFVIRNWLSPPPQRLQREMQVIGFPGVDYQAVRSLGLAAKPFKMESVVDLPSTVHCRSEFTAYADLVGQGPYPLVWNNWNLDNENQRVIVLRVDVRAIQTHIRICGGINPPSAVDLRVAWQFLLVPFNVEND